MKYIPNIEVTLSGRAMNFALAAKALVIDTEGGYTTVAKWLCGENPWGFHQDLRFSMPPSAVRQGLRIVAAAQRALDTDAEHIELSNEDYEAVLSAVGDPQRHEKEMKMPPELARCLIPIIDAIESPLDELRKSA